jgi:hypothetical protein
MMSERVEGHRVSDIYFGQHPIFVPTSSTPIVFTDQSFGQINGPRIVVLGWPGLIHALLASPGKQSRGDFADLRLKSNAYANCWPSGQKKVE